MHYDCFKYLFIHNFDKKNVFQTLIFFECKLSNSFYFLIHFFLYSVKRIMMNSFLLSSSDVCLCNLWIKIPFENKRKSQNKRPFCRYFGGLQMTNYCLFNHYGIQMSIKHSFSFYDSDNEFIYLITRNVLIFSNFCT